MANSVAIPQDIIDSIIEAVGDDRRLLKTCALVSSSFLLPSRKRLFSEISLKDDQSCQRLYQLLVENPVTQSFVRRIAIYGNKILKSQSLITILRLPFCCLESFSMNNGWHPGPAIWNNFSSDLKDALLTIIHSSTLKILHLEKISVPITLFHGIHLTKLVLSSSTLLTSEASEGATSDTVIDQFVWDFFKPMHEGPIEPILLPFMCRLRVFDIRFSPSSATMSVTILSFLIRSLRVSLTSPATLEYIKFNIVFEANDNHFNCYRFFQDLRNADVWRHLDSIITHPTGSQLKRVDINIQYLRYDPDVMEPSETEVMQPVLDALSLLREKGILFVEAEVL